MGVRRAVVVEREPALLARLTTELGRDGYMVEGMDSMQGLSPDLLARAHPDLVVVDAELPGLEPTALLVLVDALQASQPEAQVVLTREGALQWLLPWRLESERVKFRVVERQRLREEGARALGLAASGRVRVDVRAVLDEVLGREPMRVGARPLPVKLDLFSGSQLFEDREELPGVFVALSPLPEVGQPMELELEVLHHPRFRVRGRVAWQRPRSARGGRAPGVGVCLEELPPEGLEALLHMLEQRAPLALD